MAFYSLSEAEQHIMDYMWAHADQEEIHLNEIMEYMETKGYVWKQQTAYSFVIRLKNKKILSSTKRGKRRYYSVNMSRKEFIAKGVQEYLMVLCWCFYVLLRAIMVSAKSTNRNYSNL